MLCAFLLWICLCQFNFQTQPGILKGLRKTFSSSTPSLAIWSCCLRAGGVQRSARRYQSVHDLRGEKMTSSLLPSWYLLKGFSLVILNLKPSRREGLASLRGAESISKTSHCKRDVLRLSKNLRFTHHWKRKIAANYEGPVLSSHQQFGTAPFQRGKNVFVCLGQGSTLYNWIF